MSLVFFLGTAASIYIAMQGIETITKLAYHDDITTTMTEHLAMIKEAHRLKQDIVLARLQSTIPQSYQMNPDAVSVDTDLLKRWFELAKVEEILSWQGHQFRPLSSVEQDSLDESTADSIAWIGPEKLRLFAHLVIFPKSQGFERFKEVEQTRRNYKLIGERFDRNIAPAVIKSTVLLWMVISVLLLIIFLVMARTVRGQIKRITTGFQKWTDQNPQFRFKEDWSGEFLLITHQFNIMADEVETNRRRSLFLEKIASWQTIARKLAHEIKNPLTPIQMMVSQLTRSYRGDDASYRKLIDETQNIVNEEVASLRRMVDNFSEFAQLPVPKTARKDLNELVRHVVTLEQAAFPDAKIQMKSHCHQAISDIDDSLMRQVLVNLVKNAAEASKNQKAETEITLEISEKSAEFLQITVTDNGPGIPQDIQHRIFEAYFTTKHTGPEAGMGLGLAVCRKIVLDHGGELALESEPGRTSFRIRLPKSGSPSSMVASFEKDQGNP